MKFLIMSLFITLSMQASGKEQEYKCDFIWKTLSENASFMKRPASKNLTQKITKDITAALELNDKNTALSVTEFFKENKKNYIKYSFSCNRALGCNGSRESMIEGKKEIDQMIIAPNSHVGIGSINSRELFNYENKNSGFAYDYIVYRNEANQKMGLNVECRNK